MQQEKLICHVNILNNLSHNFTYVYHLLYLFSSYFFFSYILHRQCLVAVYSVYTHTHDTDTDINTTSQNYFTEEFTFSQTRTLVWLLNKWNKEHTLVYCDSFLGVFSMLYTHTHTQVLISLEHAGVKKKWNFIRDFVTNV